MSGKQVHCKPGPETGRSTLRHRLTLQPGGRHIGAFVAMDRLFGAFAPAAPAPAAAGQPAGQGQQPAARPNPLFGMLRMAVMWYMVRQFMGSGKQAKDTPREQLLMPKLLKGTPVDMALFLSEAPAFSDFGNKEALIWRETDLLLGQDSERKATYTYRPSRVSCFLWRTLSCERCRAALVPAWSRNDYFCRSTSFSVGKPSCISSG